jgi:hypothetical protein
MAKWLTSRLLSTTRSACVMLFDFEINFAIQLEEITANTSGILDSKQQVTLKTY